MASKRSRVAYEADIAAERSSFVVYGTPIPADSDVRDDGTYLPVWKQEVLDEKGRKRLHGAFTGGFSAGYFNTVGSKDGWTPATFVSSRSNRQKKDSVSGSGSTQTGQRVQQRPEDFMDDEDLAEAEEARKIQTNDDFAGLGSRAEHKTNKDALMDLFRPSGETMGTKLMKKMGWREGQGVGPKIRRRAMTGDNDDLSNATHLFAPPNSAMITLLQKRDRKGLGNASPAFDRSVKDQIAADESVIDDSFSRNEDGLGHISTSTESKSFKTSKTKSMLGVGVLNDTGSDDEDAYSMGPRILYNRVIGGDKKKKTKKPQGQATGISAANPQLSRAPVFSSKKPNRVAAGSVLPSRCHDGRLPLSGFVLDIESRLGDSTSMQNSSKYAPPPVPEGWKSQKQRTSALPNDSVKEYRSAAEVAAASGLSPESRAKMLGEASLPGKSVFDYLTPAARSRIAKITKNESLPPALSEIPTMDDLQNVNRGLRTLQSLVPTLEVELAQTALERGKTGWMPYAEDLAKRKRYQTFLEIQASLRPQGSLPDRVAGISNDDWVREMNEFSHAARIFKPVSGLMASRFTSSSNGPSLPAQRLPDGTSKIKTDDGDGDDQKPPLLSIPQEKIKDPAEEAAATGMFGFLTRSEARFYPSRLLCKRFNVPPPPDSSAEAPEDDSTQSHAMSAKTSSVLQTSTAIPQKQLELVGKKDLENLLTSEQSSHTLEARSLANSSVSESKKEQGQDQKSAIAQINPEHNDALERDRPGEELFRAVFGSDDEDD